MGPKVSVIVPIYNVEAYLPRCLDSLRRQTLSDIEIILVDDGSPDRCGEIADRYAREDSCFRVIHQANAGLSAARNRGIELATAPYLMFVDSDDWVEPDFCRIPFEAAEEHGADLVMFRHWWDSFSNHGPESKPLPLGLLSRKEAMKLLYHGAGVTVWNKLYSRNLFKTFRYPNGHVYEDHGTTCKLVQKANLIWALDDLLYHYCFRKESIVNTFTGTNITDRAEMMIREAKWLEKNGYADIAAEFFARASLSYLIRMGTDAELSQDCFRVLCEENQSILDGDWVTRFLCCILNLSPHLFDLICMFCGKRRWKRTEGKGGAW